MEEGIQQQNTNNAEDADKKNTGMAVVAYLIFFIPLLTDAKDDPFVKYHVRQGLLIFIANMLSWFLAVTFIPWFLVSLVQLGVLVLMVIGIMNALNGKEEPLPLIGHLAKHFNF